MADPELSTDQAAVRLGISRPTVRKLVRDGALAGRPVQRGTRFAWRIDEASVVAYLKARDSSADARREGKRVTVSQLRDELKRLRDEVRTRARFDIPDPAESGLRAELTTLREALVQQRAITDALAAADEARAEVVQHLIAAVTASETADERRREALAAAQVTIGQFITPGNAESLGSSKDQGL
ncbi:helix-turn-helix domain-containing protein [Mycolicibacterium wolinskyi]|nr:helix-turn-helix domain-containing protein [Mycolicibacterium wolinskyi]MCV7291184.1 helix-turn-helix domain-containing protein [Mycolicibacterium goodii]